MQRITAYPGWAFILLGTGKAHFLLLVAAPGTS
jgi:hypothetical protein